MGLFNKKCVFCGKEFGTELMVKVEKFGFVCCHCKKIAELAAHLDNEWLKSKEYYQHYYQVGLGLKKMQEVFDQEVAKRKQKWFNQFESAYSIGPLHLDIKHGLLGYRTISNLRMKLCNHCLGTIETAALFPISVIQSIATGDKYEGNSVSTAAYKNESIENSLLSGSTYRLIVKTDFGVYVFGSLEDSPSVIRSVRDFGSETFYCETPPALARFAALIQLAQENMIFMGPYEGYMKPEVEAFHRYLDANQQSWIETFHADMDCGKVIYLDKAHGLLAYCYDEPKSIFTLFDPYGRITERRKNDPRLKIYPISVMRRFRYRNYGSGDCSESLINRQVVEVDTDVERIVFFLHERWEKDYKTGEVSIPSLDALLREIVQINKQNNA